VVRVDFNRTRLIEAHALERNRLIDEEIERAVDASHAAIADLA